MGYMESLLNQIERTAAALKSAYSALVRCGVYPAASSTVEQLAGYIDDVRSTAYNAGINSEYDRFWDIYQENGSRTNYSYTFAGAGWNDANFFPKHNINPTVASYMFQSSGITNLKDTLSNLGIVLDFSNASSLTYPFRDSKITHIGVIDTRSCLTLNYLLYGARSLISVDKLILMNSGSQGLSTVYSFGENPMLENIVIEGVIGKSVSFQSSKKLTIDSAKSILTALKDYAGTSDSDKYTVYLAAETWAILDADGETSPTGTTWKEYVSSIGWLY